MAPKAVYKRQFFDCGDYVSKLCSNQELLAQFNEQLNRTVPFKRNTDYCYSMSRGKVKIETFSGITISDPSTNDLASAKEKKMCIRDSVYSFSKYFGATGWRNAVIALHEDNIYDKIDVYKRQVHRSQCAFD